MRRMLLVLATVASLVPAAVRGDEASVAAAGATFAAAQATFAAAQATFAAAQATFAAAQAPGATTTPSSAHATFAAAQAPGATTPSSAHATFAGGCFWCMQPPFENLPGVVDTTVGYTGGTLAQPTYEQVSAGGTGHAEAIDVVYDPKQIRYEQLLDVFWHNIDPLTRDAQFCDHGRQYRTAIFYHDETQRRLAEASKRALEQSGRLPGPIVTEIVPAGPFWPAEEYHQHYHEKNPVRYRYYRWSCGRDRRLQEIWGADAPAGSDAPAEPARVP